MKTIEEYMQLPYRLEIVPDTEESGFVASYPELPGCLTTGETMTDAAMNALDAKRAWLEAALADGVPIAEPVGSSATNAYSGQFKLRIPKSLHRSLAISARAEGVSLNQMAMCLIASGLGMSTTKN